ncbi:MAG TPA: dipeptide/oligopeptide/nickel ABC transporter permease/ATP-binding protein [Spirillospora sp.]|nr:dipeptide/oligopeptide/nickel ABC transporter permease/ATP-binding protein [Spirillospora sp.]
MSGLMGVVRRPAGALAAGWLILVIAATAGAPLAAPHGALDQDLGHVLAGPSADHPLGTDTLGRDLLARLLFGGRSTLLAVAEALAVYLVLGIVFGLVAGYVGRWADTLVSGAADLLFALPGIIVVLVVLAVFPGDLHAAMIAFGVLGSPGLIRILRSQALGLREELFVAAARVSGLSPAQILRRHLLPRVTRVIVVQAALFAAIVVTIQAGLGFLGLGAQPPAPSWGGLVYDASNVIDRDPWMLVPAGVPLVLTVLAFGLLGDAIRDAAVAGWATAEPAQRTPRSSKTGARTEAVAPSATGTSPGRAAGPPPDPSALLSVRNLSIEIAGTPVVQGVGFDISPGQTLGVVGESGCGKTATALGVLGLVPGGGRVTSGQVMFDGVDIAASPAALSRVRGTGIAYVSQEPMVALDTTFTIGRQLAEAIRTHGTVPRARARARTLELLAMVGVPDPAAVARRYPFQLSGGLAQRVAIALALAGDPKLLIADEPTTALDVTVQAEILALLRGLQAGTGLAILIVTHDWGVVADLCHRSVVMYAGQVVEHAEVEAMFTRPLHPYTKGLLAANPRLAVEGEPLPMIAGTVPAPRDWPSGCRFAARCDRATDRCGAGPVALTEPVPGRFSRCIHLSRLLAEGERR